MLGVDEGRDAADLLRLRDDVQGERRLAGGLRPEDLDDAAAGQPADAERPVEADGAGRDGVNGRDGVLAAKPHDGSFAELFLDLADGHFDGLHAFFVDRRMTVAVDALHLVDSVDLVDLFNAFRCCGHGILFADLRRRARLRRATAGQAATRAGPEVILGSCQVSVKRKRFGMSRYPHMNQ